MLDFKWTITFGDLAWMATVVISAFGIIHRVLDRIGDLEDRAARMEKWIDGHQVCETKHNDVLNNISKIVAFVQGQMEGWNDRKGKHYE